MVKRCSHGLCKSDDRYPERVINVHFIPFPKPLTDIEKCKKWIKLCGRPHKQLNPSKINSNRYVCSKHFVNSSGPTKEFPDPLPADLFTLTTPKSTRKAPLKRVQFNIQRDAKKSSKRLCSWENTDETFSTSMDTTSMDTTSMDTADQSEVEDIGSNVSTTECQTSSLWVDPTDLLLVVAENQQLKAALAQKSLEVFDIQRKFEHMTLECDRLSKLKTVIFSVDCVSDNDVLFKYYTGFSVQTFHSIFTFLVPNAGLCPLTYIGKGKLSQIDTLSLDNQLFLTLCKLRNAFDLKDLGYRFGITPQVAGVIFNSWVNYMFLRFGEVSIWPHRDVIYEQMPEDFRKEYPDTFAIADCTEIKIQKPSSLKVQSQTYSEYKGSNTMKALVVVDPRGTVIFSSMLFAGTMSDKVIYKESGFKSTLKHLIDIDYLKEGDGIMADKGFDIESEVEEIGLKLNIPPFAKSGSQMNQHDSILTKEIAKHRVHVERSIRRIKSFKILSHRIPLSMVSSIDQVWYVCSFLTTFMPPCIQKK